MNCYYHSANKQSTTCERCNRPICLDCVIKFKNQKKYRSIDDSPSKDTYLDELYDDVPLEELTWCLPCYYNHFNHDLSKGEKFSSKTLSVLVELVAYSIVILLILFVGNLELNLGIDANQLMSPVILAGIALLYFILFIVLFNYRSSQLRSKRDRLDEVKQKFLMITTIGTINLPIECFYCKDEIDPESFVCMNLECTLGESINKEAKEIPIEPVNTNYGFFNTLKELPKFSSEEKDEE